MNTKTFTIEYADNEIVIKGNRRIPKRGIENHYLVYCVFDPTSSSEETARKICGSNIHTWDHSTNTWVEYPSNRKLLMRRIRELEQELERLKKEVFLP